jgi:transposase-like protein
MEYPRGARFTPPTFSVGVEETLNAMLDAEADQLCGAGRYERSEARQDTRAGSYERTLQTGAGEVNLKVPKLRRQTFETAIIERYRRRESSVEEALIEPCTRLRRLRPANARPNKLNRLVRRDSARQPGATFNTRM